MKSLELKEASTIRELESQIVTKLLTIASDDTPTAPKEPKGESYESSPYTIIQERQSQIQKHYTHLEGFNGHGVVECLTEGEYPVGLLTFRIARSACRNTN